MDTQTQTTEPIVGNFATYAIGSDRYPVEIVHVSKGKNKVVVRDATVTSDGTGPLPGDNEYSGVAAGGYTVTSNPNGRTQNFYLNEHGTYQGRGGAGHLSFGQARFYRDPSF